MLLYCYTILNAVLEVVGLKLSNGCAFNEIFNQASS